MLLIEPNSSQYRAAGFALLIIAALTAAMIAVEWFETLDGTILLPLMVAHLLFNYGYVFAAIRGRLQSKGARLGTTAVILNVMAMFLSSVAILWTVLSLCAVAVALGGSFLVFTDRRGAS